MSKSILRIPTLCLGLGLAACAAEPVPGDDVLAADDAALVIPPLTCHTLDSATAALRAQGFEPGALRVSNATYREHDSAAFWKASTAASSCAYEVHGAIFVKWRALGGLAGLGGPLTNESPTSGPFGRYNHFQRGSIYWTPSTGAQAVLGGIRQHWFSLNAQQGWLGFPTTSEKENRGGWESDFQGGAIYFSWDTWQPCALTPRLRDAWRAHGGPYMDKLHHCESLEPITTVDGRGKYARFNADNRIFEGPTGAFPVHAPFGAHFDANHAATGFPTGSTGHCGGQLWLQHFEKQSVIFDQPTGRILVGARNLGCTEATTLARGSSGSGSTCTTTWSFCCVGSVGTDVSKTACSRADAIAQISASGPHCAGVLYDGVCSALTAPCDGAGLDAYDYCCEATGSDHTVWACDETSADAEAERYWGTSCTPRDGAC